MPLRQSKGWTSKIKTYFAAECGKAIFTDLNNAPLSGMAGAITAALFLKKFTKSHNMFLHFDIFGWNTKSKPGKTYGGLMQGVRSLGIAIEEKILKLN